ncbi:MAG: hypothetical protein ACXADH_18235, partial [Candidatus Kariarchaeaceae archaeon]
MKPYILGGLSIHLSPDGRDLYLGSERSLLQAETAIVQYKLKTPFKITTAEYYGHYNILLESDSDVRGINFSANGTKVFACIHSDTTSRGAQIVERTLDIPWDIKSITNDNAPTLITTGFGNEDEVSATIRGLEFNADGTKLYYIKAGGSSTSAHGYIYEHTLSSAYDLSTVSVEPSFTYGDDTVNQTDMFGYVVTESTDLQFNDDGTKLFILRNNGDGNTQFINQYHLTTPYDLSTLAYEGIVYRNYHFANPQGVHITSDGKKLYTICDDNWTVYEFDLKTPWDFNSYIYPQNMSGLLYPPVSSSEGAFFCDHGKKFYSFGNNTGDISVFNLKRPYDLTTLTEASNGWEGINLNVGGEVGNLYQFRVTEDGMNGYAAVFGNNSSGTAQFKFQTPFDFTSVYPVVVYKGQRNLSQDISNTIMDSIVSPDGKKLYELDYATDRLYEHDIKVPFDLRTARRTEGKLWVGGTSEPRGIGFGTDGKTLYWVAGNTGQIQEAKTSDDEDLYDIRTMSWSGITTTTVNT